MTRKKVWILEAVIDYEGFDIVGIWLEKPTTEQVDAAKKEDGRNYADSWALVSYEVRSP